MKVIIAEKPSVAQGIASVVGARQRKDGYLTGDGYAVTWAFGHLVGLAMPESYGFSGFRREHLPILPQEFRLVPRQVREGKVYKDDPGVVRQLEVLRELFDRCESIIVATDAGREGELIFRYVYNYLGCTKPFVRLWISSLTDKAIREGLRNLREGSLYDNLYLSAKARSEADWLVGINSSQALSLAAGQGVFSLGRVQTPTLAMICSRYRENKQFVPRKYFQIKVSAAKDGIAFSALGTFTGHPVHIFMPDWASEERKKLMAMYGATLHLISREAGGFNAALQGARDLAEEIGGFQPKQFENQDNPEAHYLTTGVEILRQLPDVTDFVAGVGSGGTLMGTARRLKADHAVRAVAVEPDAVPLLSGGTVKGAHHIEGIGDDFIPAVVDQTLVDGVMDINDLDAIAMAAKFGRVLGLGVGISSGANFLGSVIQNLEPGRKVATVFADDSKKYLTTMLSNPPAETADMWSSRIELLDYEPVETL